MVLQICDQTIAGERCHAPSLRLDTNVPHDHGLHRCGDLDYARLTSFVVVEPEGGNILITPEILRLLTTGTAFPLGQ